MSPTAALESVLIISAIDAHEERDVAIADCPGAFLSANMDDEVIMCLRGKLAEFMVTVAPSIYRKYITVDKNNRPVLYVKLQKALYGCLKSALLFYKKLVNDLLTFGFELNPYDPCVANKMIKGSQCTVVWHVDDLKISHKDPEVVTGVLTYLKQIYREDMRISRGTKHDYLGMQLDFSNKGYVDVTMVDYIKEVITDFPEEIQGCAATPATGNLYVTKEEGKQELLSDPQSRIFHHTVAQLLFIAPRARKDIQTAVSFLTTRVKAPDEDDWKNF